MGLKTFIRQGAFIPSVVYENTPLYKGCDLIAVEENNTEQAH